MFRTEMPVWSKDYVRMPIEAREAAGPVNPMSLPIVMGFTTDRKVEPTVWSTAIWELIDGQYWGALLVGPGSTHGVMPSGRYWVCARVTDNPEIPALTSTNQFKFL